MTTDGLTYSPHRYDMIVEAVVDGIRSTRYGDGGYYDERPVYVRHLFEIFNDAECGVDANNNPVDTCEGGCSASAQLEPSFTWHADVVVDEQRWLKTGVIVDAYTGAFHDPDTGRCIRKGSQRG